MLVDRGHSAAAGGEPPARGAERLSTGFGRPRALRHSRSGCWPTPGWSTRWKRSPTASQGCAVTREGRVWRPGTGELRQAASGGGERLLEQRNARARLVGSAEAAAREEQRPARRSRRRAAGLPPPTPPARRPPWRCAARCARSRKPPSPCGGPIGSWSAAPRLPTRGRTPSGGRSSPPSCEPSGGSRRTQRASTPSAWAAPRACAAGSIATTPWRRPPRAPRGRWRRLDPPSRRGWPSWSPTVSGAWRRARRPRRRCARARRRRRSSR